MSEHGDKRSVSTDALETLGMIIEEGQGRDAIHLAVEPIQAACKLHPGQDVGLVDGKAAVCDNPVGIVDPFLKQAVLPGEYFWLVVYPRKITSLRHVWSHPAFPETSKEAVPPSKAASEAWLREFCSTNDCPDYETVFEVLNSGKKGTVLVEDYSPSRIDGDSFFLGGVDGHCSIPPEFWDHAETVTGKKFDTRPSYFSCSC